MGERDAVEIDYGPLRRAMDRLREAIAERERQPGNEFVRDSVVQRFEFTYELAVVMLRRFLQSNMVTRGDAKEMTLPTLIRTGSEHGLLLNDWERWYEFRKARNTTSHAYDEARAKLAVELAPSFLQEAEHLYTRLVEESQ